MKRMLHHSRPASPDSKVGHSHVPRSVAVGAALGVVALLLLASLCQAGTVWNPAGVPVCTAGNDQYAPQAASDGAGGAIITWYDYRANNSRIYAQRVDSSGKVLWTAGGVPIRSISASSAYNPCITADGAGGAIIAWYDYRTSPKIYAQRVNAQGVVQWAPDGIPLCASAANQYDPVIAYDGANGAVVTWRDYRGPSGIYAQRVNGAGSTLWGADGVAVCTVGVANQNRPSIATDGTHGAIITWQDQRNGSGNFDVFAQRINQAGAPAWVANGINVCTASGSSVDAEIASDAAGGAVIAWQDGRSGNEDDIYAQRVSGAGAALWPANGVRVCGAPGEQQAVQLISDGSGNSILTWEDSRSGTDAIYAQKLLSSGAKAPGWAASGLAVSTSNITHNSPILISDGSGGAIIAWTQGSQAFFDGGGSGASLSDGTSITGGYAQQVLSGGVVSPGWATNGEPICDVESPQYATTIVSDGGGGAIVGWEDYRNSSYDVYAQRLRASTSTWYLAEGTSAWGYSTYITIENPNPVNVAANITYMTPQGAIAPKKVTLPAMSQTTVDPLAAIGYKTDFSTKVQSANGLPIGVDRTMTWTGPGAPSGEAHSSVGVNSPNTTWYLPEGCSGFGFESWLLIQNPNANKATCTVTYMIQGAGPKAVTKVVPANSRRSYSMADDIGQQSASIQVVSDIPVVPERSMYRNNRREGSDSTGATEAATDYYLAEGTTNYGFTTWVLVQNPNASPCLINLTYMTPQGPKPQPPFSMAPYSRQTVRVNDVLRSSDFSTQVHSDQPIIAERALYWGGGTALGEAMHDSIGVASPHTLWYLPDGQSSEGRETYTLVQNPNDTPVVVEISYLAAGGGSGNVTFMDTIQAQSRKTYSLADKVPSGRAAIMVSSKTRGEKIIVERSMYWNSRGAGTCTIGGFSN